MARIIILGLSLATLAVFTTVSIAKSQQNTVGLHDTIWKTVKERGWKTPANCKSSPSSIVSFKQCSEDSDEICGTIRALNPSDSQLSAVKLARLRDRLNPYVKLRTRKILGLKVIHGLSPLGPNLVGDGYSPCRGEYGKICMQRVDDNRIYQWACLAGAGCDAPGFLCTPKYVWTKVEGVPEGWVEELHR